MMRALIPVALLTVALQATAQDMRGQGPQTLFSNPSTGIINPSVEATWITERPFGQQGSGSEELTLLVLWRGEAGWHRKPGPNGFRAGGGGTGGRISATVVRADIQLDLEYDRMEKAATVAGKRIDISVDNVIFVDEVHVPGGARVTGTTRVPRALPGSSGQIGLVLIQSPEIISFLRCDADRLHPTYSSGLCIDLTELLKMRR